MIVKFKKNILQYAGKLTLTLGVALTLTACAGNQNDTKKAEQI